MPYEKQCSLKMSVLFTASFDWLTELVLPEYEYIWGCQLQYCEVNWGRIMLRGFLDGFREIGGF